MKEPKEVSFFNDRLLLEFIPYVGVMVGYESSELHIVLPFFMITIDFA